MRRRLLSNICEIEIIDKIDTVAGDICVVDNDTLEKYFITSDSVECLKPDKYTPIGVVVVPASHTDDGTSRVMSLVVMNYDKPDSGDIREHRSMSWGGEGYDVPDLDYKVMYPVIAEDLRDITGEQQITGWYNINDMNWCLPSDYYTIYPNPYDEDTFYMTGTTSSSSSHAAPSPYLEDGSKNPIYHDTSNTGNICADMDGKSNTEKILAVDNGAGTDWQTAATITNTGNTETIHPAAQCCWRYHTIGTNQGDWYLPSAGELGYLVARWKAINTSIHKIRDFGVFYAVILYTNTAWWSCTEYSSVHSASLYLRSEYAFLTNNAKGINGRYVRAFLSV